MGAEAAALLASPVWRGSGVPAGSSRPVLLVPGFLAGDSSLTLMSSWLKRVGYGVHGSGIVTNVECSERAVTKLEGRVIDLSEQYGEPVSIIGHSRGGMFARVLAVRQPHRVASIVTLGSPLVPSMDDLHPLLRFQIRALQRVQKASGEGLLATSCEQSFQDHQDCTEGLGCCRQFWADLDDDMPEHVRFTSIYSRSDGVLHWRSCLDHQAELVEIQSSHCGMACNARVFAAIGDRLAVEPFVRPVAASPVVAAEPRRAAATTRARAERVL